MTEQDVQIDNLMERLDFCNCGMPEKALAAVRDCLLSINTLEYPREPGEWITVYLLESKGYLEHGSNICAAWPTPSGEALLTELLELELDK